MQSIGSLAACVVERAGRKAKLGKRAGGTRDASPPAVREVTTAFHRPDSRRPGCQRGGGERLRTPPCCDLKITGHARAS